ncbi:MAG: hypothetical protein ACJAT2_002498 [Bacteriovoracaceae bacterium]|jgi:hypothetical protein
MKFLLVAFTLLSFNSLAGPGHGHSHGGGHSHGHNKLEIKKSRTGVIGRIQVERLVHEKKLDVSWKKATFEKSVLKDGEWLVTFTNEKGVKGKKLYIFLKKSGEFVAANFTGK